MKYIIVLLTFFVFTNISFAQDGPLEGTEKGIKLEKDIQQKKAKAMGGNRGRTPKGSIKLPNDNILYIVDGVSIDMDVFSELDKEGIEQINVLKEKEEIAAYGDSTKRGVIVITLKKEYKEEFKKMMEKEKK